MGVESMRKYFFTLPVYQKNKGKDFLLSMNWYNTTNNFVIDPYKKLYHNLVSEQLEFASEDEKLKQYKTHYKLYIDKTNCDMMNVVSVIDKFFQDGLVKFGLVNDDNVTIYKKISAECVILEIKKVKGKKVVEGVPRIEIIVEEIEKGN